MFAPCVRNNAIFREVTGRDTQRDNMKKGLSSKSANYHASQLDFKYLTKLTRAWHAFKK